MNDFAFAQQTGARKDSTKFYKNIETYSQRSKFTKFIYSLIFKPIASNSKKKEVKKKVSKKQIQKPYSAFEGKTIRHINIIILDPFGYSLADTIVKSQNFLSKTGNKLHVKTQLTTIRNLLLIRQNQIFDSLLVKESERLIRSQVYIQDVSFFVITTTKNSDSVDIFIRELDKWSITFGASFSGSLVSIKLNDKNFLGFGHEFKNAYSWYHTTGGQAYNTNYFIPNIHNTYINSTLHYDKNEFGNFIRSFAIDRPFFSPFAKWAGGVNFTQQFRNDSIRNSNSFFIPQRLKFNSQDYWVGNAMQIFKGNTENIRTTNFVSTVRFLRIRYLEKPIAMFDTLHAYSDENFYLAGIGISTRKYVQDKFIFNYGVTEDVPVGNVYGLTVGYQVKNNIGRLYAGIRFSFGNYNEWGYLSYNIEYGTFFHASHAEQGTFTAGINYFTGLFEIGKWKFRQYVKPMLTVGINRFPYENITINDENFVRSFSSSSLTGTKKIVLTLQTQSYSPWNVLGFRFGPYLIYSLGILGNDASGFKNSKIYSLIGLGVLIKNEYLIFNTFQFSISFFPIIPGIGTNILKTNSFKTNDFGFRDFEIGKPSVIVFQ
ncbi:MAG: hypothetical protein HGB12_01115 [Bacteroidetes bacterium]|nr:hypothetical protein [Bacteroidota bacterium]